MREQVRLAMLVDRICALERPHPVRVAIDGIDAAGKTTLADGLAVAVGERGRAVVRAGVDGFHNPRRIRHSRGRESPEGYFLDSFDYATLERVLLQPLGPGGSRAYRSAVFDWRLDAPVEMPERHAASNAVLLFDGIFSQRQELVHHWDYTVFVDVAFEVALERACRREGADVGDLYRSRVLPAQEHYLAECDPRGRADAVLCNDDPEGPELVRLR